MRGTWITKGKYFIFSYDTIFTDRIRVNSSCGYLIAQSTKLFNNNVQIKKAEIVFQDSTMSCGVSRIVSLLHTIILANFRTGNFDIDEFEIEMFSVDRYREMLRNAE